MTTLKAVACYLPDKRVPVEDVAGQLGLPAMQVRLFRRFLGLAEIRLDHGGSLLDLLSAATSSLGALRGLEHSVRYVLYARALPVVDVLQESAAQIEFHRVPELYCGMRRASGMRPVLYPVSCSPQAWASGALFMMLQGMLGILPDAPSGALHIRNPVLPAHLSELTISDLRVGTSRVSLRFVRHASRTLVNVLSVESGAEPLKVQIEFG